MSEGLLEAYQIQSKEEKSNEEKLKEVENVKKFENQPTELAILGNAGDIEPHPICVMDKFVNLRKKGLNIEEAVKKARNACILEGKYHGISRLVVEARRLGYPFKKSLSELLIK
jgi:hypothetical protein